MHRLSLTLAAVAALFVAAPAGAAETIFDEDFESGLGAFTTTGQVGINTGAAYQASGCCGVFGSQASLDNHFVAFGSGDQPSGTLESAPFNILAGEIYTLTFDLYQLGDTGFSFENFTIQVGGATFTINEDQFPKLFDLDLAPTTQRTIGFSLGTNMTTTLRFSSGGENSVDAVIDNLLFTGPAGAVITAVPEPATWAMLLLGFGSIGLAMRRNGKHATPLCS